MSKSIIRVLILNAICCTSGWIHLIIIFPFSYILEADWWKGDRQMKKGNVFFGAMEATIAFCDHPLPHCFLKRIQRSLQVVETESRIRYSGSHWMTF